MGFKKIHIILCIILSFPIFGKGWGFAIYAQNYVPIPDTNFAAALQSIVPAAMSGNQIDTSNMLVTTTTYSIYVPSSSIANLFGIQYFKSLKYLDCSNNQITSLPILAVSLQILNCPTNQLTSLPPLPNSLTNLNCSDNQLSSLPIIPTQLQVLYCDNNLLTGLPVLSNTLTKLRCGTNQLTNLPVLPNSLTYLFCPSNQLTSLPALPTLLTYLNCFFNLITDLPTLPDSLHTLFCSNNQLISLPALPNFITTLYCNNNNIQCFPHFPNSLNSTSTSLVISNNPFTCLPNYIYCTNPTILTYPLCNLDNSNGCPVSKDAPTEIIVPNIFTPNGDNINDEFCIKGSNLTNFSCSILNRWGLLVYQWSDINIGWNGKNNNGTGCDDGVYYYQVSYTDNTKKVNNKSGFLQLLR